MCAREWKCKLVAGVFICAIVGRKSQHKLCCKNPKKGISSFTINNNILLSLFAEVQLSTELNTKGVQYIEKLMI